MTARTQNCARRALEVDDSLDKLKLNLFGVNNISRKMEEFSNACNVPSHDTRVLRRVIDDGIKSYDDANREPSRHTFSAAQRMVLVTALEQIYGMM
ncbi:hypothetical protein DRQ25_00360 [Candidatus Fermentibacteria bacterium]|nr:MAG: hypothetical protein DRQ25_00360 [Candidatus Fermentibacteria bacterium]